MRRNPKTVASVIGVLTLTLALTACGRRGPLEAPDASYSGDSNPGYSGEGSGSLEDAVIGYESEKPKRKFILDGLI